MGIQIELIGDILSLAHLLHILILQGIDLLLLRCNLLSLGRFITRCGGVPTSIARCLSLLHFLQKDESLGIFIEDSLSLRLLHELLRIGFALLLQDILPFGEGVIIAECGSVFGIQLLNQLLLLLLGSIESLDLLGIVVDLHRGLRVGLSGFLQHLLLLLEFLIGFLRLGSEMGDDSDQDTDGGCDPSEHGDG